ncbi:MAG: acyl--CoA ligase [Lachnospiraceae bacterium]|nr:acyl--CoA ligase [Lachnospiraceae bacterium]
MPITHLLERNAKEYPDDIALVALNPEIDDPRRLSWKEYDLIQKPQAQPYRRELTWRTFNEKANRVAHLLLSRDVKKGDKVGILMMNCLEWLPIYFGILKSGAIAVPLNFRYDSSEIEYCVELADVSVLFFGVEFIERLNDIKDTLMQNRLLLFIGDGSPDYAEDYYREVSDCPSNNPEIPLTDDDFGAIYFSSGTTGFPKAILHKHRSLSHSAKVEQSHHNQQKDDVFLCIPPLYHTGAKMHWFGSLYSASKAVLLTGIRPETILKAVSQEKCTIVWLLVPWAQDILDAIDRGQIKLEDYELDQWRLMHIGAQPVPKSLVRRWLKYFPNHQYDTNYGLSEAIGPGCVHLGVENVEHVGAIGIPGYGWECRILDENHENVQYGEVGELAVRGPGVMIEYYKNPEATKESLSDDGWLYTGDMAKQDEYGLYYLVDRKKDVIITGGENLYPVQIEDFIHKHEAVKDVAVIGLPDPRLGEIATAIVEIKTGYHCTEYDLNDFCRDLPKYKRPRKYIFAPVPRNATGKIEKPYLRQLYGGANIVAGENEG